MKIIVGGRASGKTTKLIKESAETGYRIVTSNEGAAKAIYMRAKDLGYDILRPISVMEYVLAPNSFEQDGILIDELENTLGALFKQKIHAATFCSENMPLLEISTKGTPAPKFIRGETVFKIEPEFVLRNENFELEKRVKVYRIKQVFVNKKSVSYLLCGKKYRVQEQFLYKTYKDAERAMNEKEE